MFFLELGLVRKEANTFSMKIIINNKQQQEKLRACVARGGGVTEL